MCATALVLAAVSVVTSGVGAVSTMSAAGAQADQAAYEAKIRIKQADEQRRASEIQALEQENARTAEFERTRSAALAAIGAAGIGEHISFLQGIEPEAQKAYLRDVRNVRLNLVQQRSTLADQVQVAEFGSRIAGFNAGVAKVGALAEFAQTAMTAASFYYNYRTPPKQTPPPPKGG